MVGREMVSLGQKAEEGVLGIWLKEEEKLDPKAKGVLEPEEAEEVEMVVAEGVAMGVEEYVSPGVLGGTGEELNLSRDGSASEMGWRRGLFSEADGLLCWPGSSSS